MQTSSQLFVALPPLSSNDLVIFGMNSFRPVGEVHEVVYFPASDHPDGSTVKCSFIELKQINHVCAVVLSKPVSWWGAEMGANEHGVSIGYTHADGSAVDERGLTGGDLVRLGLERADSAERAVDIVLELVSAHGLNGPLDVFPLGSVSMLICDRSEAWILESVGKHTAAVRMKSGAKHLGGELTIRTEFEKSSTGLREFAAQHQRWSDGDGDFDFTKAFSKKPRDLDGTKSCGIFQEIIGKGDFTPQTMLDVLRHSQHVSSAEGYSAVSSQLSILPRSVCDSGAQHFSPLCVHWFTATTRPDRSFFKPFVFGGNRASVCDRTTAPCRNATSEHALWIAHRRFTSRLEAGDKKSESILANIRELEQQCFEDVDQLIHGGEPSDQQSSGKADHVSSLFEHMVDLEINFYN